MTLIPAKNIYEFADIISPETPIRKEDRAFYVDIFPDILETLRDKLI